MDATEETEASTKPTVPDDENEPIESTQPYITEEDPKSKHTDNEFDSSEKATSPLLAGSSSTSSSTKSSIPIDLNNRETRLTLWSIAYFIFCICEFSGNTILADQNSNPKSAYQTWAASDFFLLIGASLLFIECNPRYILDDLRSNEIKMHKIIRYIICGLFVLGGILRWIALGKHNDINCSNSHCNSWHFAQDFMATWFSFVIAIDCINLFEIIDMDQRVLRVIVYDSLLILCSIIVISYYDYVRSNYIGPTFNCILCPINAAETGWFFILFMLIMILIIAILVCVQKYDRLVSNDKIRKYLHFGIAIVLNIGVGLAYYSSALLFQTLLAIVALLMITFDFMNWS